MAGIRPASDGAPASGLMHASGLLHVLGLNPTHQKALFRLRARLAWRQYVSEPGRIVGLVVFALVLLPLIGGAAVGTTIGYLRLPSPWPAQLLGGVLVLLWGIWLLAPLIMFSLNEGMDMTRLLVYPVTRRDLAVSFVLGTLFDFPTYLMLPIFIAVVIGWAASPALLILPLALLLAYGHMVLTSQLVVTIAGGIFLSRRFRDIIILVLSLLGSSCYLLQNGIRLGIERLNVDAAQLEAWRPLDTLQWLPPGAAARAIEQASQGDWGSSLLWLGYAAVWLLVIGWAWSRLLMRWLTGEGFLISGAPRVEKPKQTKAKATQDWLAWLPSDLRNLTVKELKSLWRTPQRRVGLIQAFIMPLFLGGIFFVEEAAEFVNSPWFNLALPVYGLFMFWILGQNMMGMEGEGLANLFVTPVPRQRIFLAKGAALMLVMGLVLLLLAALLWALGGSWLVVSAFLTSLSLGGASLAVNAILSVLFPVPVNLESSSRRGIHMTGGSCLTGLVLTFLAPIGQGLAALPALAPLVLALIFEQSWIALVGLLPAVVYGLLVFWYGTKIAGNLLVNREPEVLAATRLPDQDTTN